MTTPSNASNSTQHSALPEDVAQDVSLIQEQFPKISEKIIQLWGSSELRIFLDSILFDERGDRHGFPSAIASALLRIHKNHITQPPPESWI